MPGGKEKTENFDVAIIGGGCTGLAAAMYSGRLELKTLLVSENLGGLILWTDIVENYPGFKRLSGQELVDKLKEHAMDYKEHIKTVQANVSRVKGTAGNFSLETDEGNFSAKTLIFATGTKVKELDVPGSKEFRNKGIQFCALCDGALFKGKEVAVVGGSDSAVKEAIVLARYAKKVFIIYRGGKLRGEPSNMERLEALSNVEIICNTNVTAFKGGKFLESVVLDKPHNGKKELALDAVFMAIGHIPLSGLAAGLGVKTNGHGEIIIDRSSSTNVEGVFAAGDVVDTAFKQAIVGVGEAVSAVYSAFRFVSGNAAKTKKE
ncbi:MAG: FAD-dependent oxidoreductase [Candidatus Diapherotrites archaeon]|nr:FAD-dependent oxidoreductase [Candidatus Diapherotrites archaeon]